MHPRSAASRTPMLRTAWPDRLLEKKGLVQREEFRALLVEVDLEEASRTEAQAAAPPSTSCRTCRASNDPANRFCAGCRRPLVRR